jgi:tetratricopeptide (TPR) repeat protein
MAAESANQPSGDESPPDQITPAQRRRLQQCFDHANKLMAQEKYDFDYANTLLTECAAGDPSNIMYVDAFLSNLQRKYDNNKRGAKLKGFANRGTIKKAVAKEEWLQALQLGPPMLKPNPWDVPTLRLMAEACAGLGYHDVELRYLKMALDANPKDIEVNRHCAKSLARVGQYDQAIACWHRVEEAKKGGDKEAAQMISDLTVERARPQSGPPRPTGGAKRPHREASPETDDDLDEVVEPPAAAKRREIRLTRRQILEKAIVDSPVITENYIELAGILIGERRWPEAERILAKALQVAPGELKIREQLEDVQMARGRHQLGIAENQAQQSPSDEANELVARMRGECVRRELEVYHARVERYPDDPTPKFELGLRLKWNGNFAEAAQQFEQARHKDTLAPQAALELGECLQHLKEYPKALECYTLSARLAGEKSEHKKLALYRAGVLATGLRELDAAEKHLNKLAAIDSAYKDVSARLDKVRQIRDKQ